MPELKLGLDPGPGPRRRKMSICKCLCWTIGIPLLCFTTWAIASFATNVVQGARFPHKSLYHNGPSYYAGDVIRPLITDEQSFDIAVSVWVRTPEGEEARSQSLQQSIPAPTPTQLDLGGNIGKVWVSLSLDGNDRFRDQDILEKPLFSDIVFHGLHLSDKHASATVDFRLPIARFLATNLAESDLRATFLLLPTSPSLIDHVKNFSSWMPDSVFPKRPLTRPWPFPLGSEEHGEKTMADLALESFSISIPLIEFHNATSQCLDASDVVENHPYVVTRTQLRIVRETRLFNAKAYNEVRDEIKRHSCGQGIPGIKPHLRMCRRTYKSNGNFETRLELEVPKESGVETQWAYAPYLDTKAHSAGPLDLIPVPVDWENCSSTAKDDYMDVSWHIAFAGRSPGKHIWADNFVSPYIVDPHASELMKVSQQSDSELWNGAMGHRFHDDAHPRRRIAISVVSAGCQGLAALLLLYYWWTRVSTAGISPSSCGIFEGDASVAVIVLLALFVPVLMCKAITRAELGWQKWHPTLRRAPANHRERMTKRMDGRTSWGSKLGVRRRFYLVTFHTINCCPSC
ncbi:hypothetical protein B0H11DRAFT_2024732 [Mycena galericulata]|nr:hypothetical protein B0H11DRAFT_2024732 [Mycena galericulata]